MINADEAKVGDIVWHCLPSDEEGGSDIKWPQKAKIASIYPGSRRFYVCAFNETTGVVDDDSNACSTARAGDLFESKGLAFDDFIFGQMQIIVNASELIEKAKKEKHD